MVNNYDVAVLSEKVAYLEAAIKNAGIELPEVTEADNGKTLQVIEGAWGTGGFIPDQVTANPTGTITNDLAALQIGTDKFNIIDLNLSNKISGFNVNASGDSSEVGGSVTIDLSAFSRRLFVLVLSDGLYIVNIWTSSGVLTTIKEAAQATPTLSGRSLTITNASGQTCLYALLQVY